MDHPIVKNEDVATSDDVTPSIAEEENLNEQEEYSYINRPGFTSEIFKIEIHNFYGKLGFKQMKQLLEKKLNLKPHKIKINQNPIFVTFRCEEDREKALLVINDFEFKGRKLRAMKAKPMADPFVQKRKEGLSEDIPNAKKSRVEPEDDIPVEEKLKNAVVPLWRLSYDDQLESKQKELRKLLVRWSKNLQQTVPALSKWLNKQRLENNFMCCPLEKMRPSPEINGYRNKCEFNIGRHLETGLKTVGFRINRYKDGSKSVAAPDGCLNVSQAMINAAKVFEKYIIQSDKDVFNPETHEGYWRQLTVRSSRNDHLMLIVVIHPQQLTNEEIELEKIKVKDFLLTDKDCEMTSLYLQCFSKRESVEAPFQHIWGQQFIEETLLDMKFRISPEAFFQVNTSAAEILYKTVKELADIKPTTTVLDLCCGTGTIGLTLAKDAKKVIGVELCSAAVTDAKFNATLNQISNATFLCSKVEDVIFDLINTLDDEVVAIVDPPRAGLNNKVIKAIRGAAKIKHLVYISCNPTGAMTNFVDLSRSISNNYQGVPFLPVQAIPVDLFPHTPHCELVILFKRQEK